MKSNIVSGVPERSAVQGFIYTLAVSDQISPVFFAGELYYDSIIETGVFFEFRQIHRKIHSYIYTLLVFTYLYFIYL